MSVLGSLQARLIATLVLGVIVALATVALVARWVIAAEFDQYVAGTRAEMQFVAQEVALTTGKRLVVMNAQGTVVLDSAGAPVAAPADTDVIFVRPPLPLVQPAPLAVTKFMDTPLRSFTAPVPAPIV